MVYVTCRLKAGSLLAKAAEFHGSATKDQLLPRFLLSTSAGWLAPPEVLRQLHPLWVSYSDMATSSLFLCISRDDHFPSSVPEDLYPYFKPEPTAGKE